MPEDGNEAQIAILKYIEQKVKKSTLWLFYVDALQVTEDINRDVLVLIICSRA